MRIFKTMGQNCGCGAHSCGDENDSSCVCDKNRTPEEKVEDLKEAIQALGYSVEDTEDGEIKISNS